MTQEQLNELHQLTETYRVFQNTELGSTLEGIISDLLINSYGEEMPCGNDPLTCDRPDCCQEISPELYAALMQKEEEPKRMTYEDIIKGIEEAAKEEMEYTNLDTVLQELFANKGLRAARKGWDNVANQEYIQHAPFVGPVKIYQTSTIKNLDQRGKEKSYFKNVIHTFEPTKDDDTANDWYFL